MKKKGVELIVQKERVECVNIAADIIEKAILNKPNIVLGLATGNTVIPLYKELVKRYKKGKIDFKKVTTFNLDSYVKLDKKSKSSFANFMQTHLFSKINIKKKNIHFLDGNSKDLYKECREYEKKIGKAGGIDLQILGIGRNAHIAFNEPGSKIISKTRVIELDKSTIRANSKFFKSSKEVPKKAMTLGISNILKSKKIILLAFGGIKKKAISDTFNNRISKKYPASFLRTHKNCIFILDKKAYF